MATYADISSDIQDNMRNARFVSTREAEIKRAVNSALDDINVGNTGDDSRKIEQEVGYDFQKRITTFSYTSGTEEYSFATLVITSADFKFSSDLRINSDENEDFILVENDQYRRKVGVNSSKENIYTFYWKDGIQYIRVNHDTTESLDLEWYDNNMVLNTASSRVAHFSDENTSGHDTETLLMPDRYKDVVVNLACGRLMSQQKGIKDKEYQKFIIDGRAGLRYMIQAIGKIREMPRKRPRIRSEWALSSPTRVTQD